ncbi:MAG TPA: F0F1 ATP synthase subunit epsilon [Firmicutes bacterium]|jgi:F-type H+-transporting ATPase subunit epsilon|nr:F0F1 ATP synthase subunit epsilon [Bacillota bacterium]
MSPVIFEVVTPERKILREEVENVIAPGTEGYLGVLPGHTPLLTTLKPGVVSYRRVGGETEKLACSGGFMEAGPGRVVILGDTAEPAPEIDIERARRARQRAEQRLRERPPGLDVARAEAALLRSLARLKAAGAD